MLNVKEYISSYEESVQMIKEGINKCDRKELYDLINNRGIFVGIRKLVRDTFCSSNYDDFGNVYLFDELNPQKITEYILINSKYQIDFELAYCLVCDVLEKKINKFYKELNLYEKNNSVVFRISKTVYVPDFNIIRDKYRNAMNSRIVTGYKQIRRK